MPEINLNVPLSTHPSVLLQHPFCKGERVSASG